MRLAERVDVNKEDWPVVDAWVEATVRAVAQLSLKTFAELGVGEHGTLALRMGSGHRPKLHKGAVCSQGWVTARGGSC